MAAEILTVDEMQAADAAAGAAGISGLELMRRAGQGTAEALARRRPGGSALVLCGPGSNGGDGYVIAARLRELGWEARIAETGVSAAAGDAAEARRGFAGAISPLSEAALRPGEIVIDALFGAGLNRSLEGEALAALRRAEEAGAEIFAVDVPSGLQGDLATPLGYAPRARASFTFHRKKPAHVLESGRAYCGEVVVVDIGLAPPAGALLFENTPDLWAEAFPRPGPLDHKTRRGRLMVVSGPALRTGAARLAARAGLRAGAGLVTMLTAPSAGLVNAVALEAVMVEAVRGPDALCAAAANADAVVIGPAAGVGEATRSYVLGLKALSRRLVIDADALTSFREAPEALFARLDAGDVLTPHAGEFERLFPGLLGEAPERISAARAAARRSGAVVLLKGADTVVAAPDGRASVNTHASPFLATAGSGDVLAGMTGAYMAQGMETFLAASCAVFLHGDAGLRAGPGLISEDLPECLPQSLRRLYALRNWSLAAPL